MKKVLVIDDEITIKTLCSQLESFFDFEVTLLHDYRLWELELNNGYNAIIIDVAMPILPSFFVEDEVKNAENGLKTGIVLFEKIRMSYPEIPIIFYSFTKERICCDEKTIIIRKPKLSRTIANALNYLIDSSSTI